MGKIGRNQACTCGSGKKYKHCCLPAAKTANPPPQQADARAPLRAMIERVQRNAAANRTQFYELGVFLFFTTSAGDAWMLELTESDALQIASKGEALPTSVQEDKESITINFSHTFAIRDRELYLSAYGEDSLEFVLNEAPVMRISAALRRLRKNYSSEVLDNLHLDADEQEQQSNDGSAH